MKRNSWIATVKTEEAKQLIIDLILKIEDLKMEYLNIHNKGDTTTIRNRLTNQEIATIHKVKNSNSAEQNNT